MLASTIIIPSAMFSKHGHRTRRFVSPQKSSLPCGAGSAVARHCDLARFRRSTGAVLLKPDLERPVADADKPALLIRQIRTRDVDSSFIHTARNLSKQLNLRLSSTEPR